MGLFNAGDCPYSAKAIHLDRILRDRGTGAQVFSKFGWDREVGLAVEAEGANS